MEGFDATGSSPAVGMSPIRTEKNMIDSIKALIGYDTPSRPLLSNRAPLVDQFKSRYGYTDETDEDIRADLENRFRTSIADELGIPGNDDTGRLDGAVERWRPIWGNAAEREAIQALARMEGDTDELAAMFPGDYVGGGISGHQVDDIVPTNSMRPIEAQRAFNYWNQLHSEDPLEYSDVALGRHEASDLMRDGKTNWFQGDGIFNKHANSIKEGQLSSVGPYANDGAQSYTGLGGPNNAYAQGSPIGSLLFMNGKDSPLLTGFMGAVNMVPRGHKYSVAMGDPAGYDRARERTLMDMQGRRSFMGEAPTANVYPTQDGKIVSRYEREVQNKVNGIPETDENPDGVPGLADHEARSQQSEGQQYVEDLGVSDRENTPYRGVLADIFNDIADHNFLGTLGRLGKGLIKPLLYDIRNEGMFNMGQMASQEDGFADIVPRKQGDPGYGKSPSERSAERESLRQPSFDKLQQENRFSHMPEVIGEANPTFLKMIAKNKHLQTDRMKEAESRHEDDLRALDRMRKAKAMPQNYTGAF